METVFSVLPIYLLIGAMAGIIGGMFGLGGGIIIVPALMFLFIFQGMPAPIIMHLAVATSLASIVFTSLSSTLAHHKREAVLWQNVFLLVPGIIAGGLLGGLIADFLHSNTLQIVFGLFEIFVAAQIVFNFMPRAQRQLPGKTGMVIIGTGIGGLSTVLGIGGGTITVPFLMWCNVNIRNAVATSAACGFPIAIAGTVSMIIIGLDNPLLPTGTTGYVYWPAAAGIMISSVLMAPVGARIAHSIPVVTLKKMFAVILLIVGIKMLTG